MCTEIWANKEWFDLIWMKLKAGIFYEVSPAVWIFFTPPPPPHQHFHLQTSFQHFVHLWTLKGKTKTVIACWWHSFKIQNVWNMFLKSCAKRCTECWKKKIVHQERRVLDWDRIYKCITKFLWWFSISTFYPQHISHDVDSHPYTPEKVYNISNKETDTNYQKPKKGKVNKSEVLETKPQPCSLIHQENKSCYVILWRMSLWHVNSMALKVWDEAYAYVCWPVLMTLLDRALQCDSLRMEPNSPGISWGNNSHPWFWHVESVRQGEELSDASPDVSAQTCTHTHPCA